MKLLPTTSGQLVALESLIVPTDYFPPEQFEQVVVVTTEKYRYRELQVVGTKPRP